jgi:hypothetical protein
MERSWIYAVVGAAALFVVVIGIRRFSNSDTEEPAASHPQVASLPQRVLSEKGGWVAKSGDSIAAGTTGTHGSGSPGAGGGAMGGAQGGGTGATDAPSSGQRGASVFVDRSGTRAGTGSGAAGLRGAPSGAGGGDPIQVGASVPALDVPFEGARAITGGIGGGGQIGHGGSHDTVQQVTDKPADGSKPPEDGGPVLSLPFDKTTQPEKGDTAVFEQGVTFDSGQGAVFSTDSQFVVPNGGNLSGEGGAISMWVQPGWAGGDESNASLAQLRNQNQWEDRLQIFKNGMYMRFLMSDTAGQESNIGTNISDWAPGDWHHIVASWGPNDSGQLTQSFYVDGRLIGQVPVQGQFNVRPGTPLYIGSDLPLGIPGANGAISQFKAYGAGLTPDQVTNLNSERPQ